MTEQSEGSDIQAREDHKRVLRDIDGRSILFDKEGFFWHAEDWSKTAAEILAREAGMAGLTDAHWQVIDFLRAFYLEQGRAPLNAQLKAGTGMALLELERLFPGGIKNGARRLAGLPNPKTCAG
jgi:tRNA 2-thiouridine synthesizing protein E